MKLGVARQVGEMGWLLTVMNKEWDDMQKEQGNESEAELGGERENAEGDSVARKEKTSSAHENGYSENTAEDVFKRAKKSKRHTGMRGDPYARA